MYLIKYIFRFEICKLQLREEQKIDYIYCLRYEDNNAVQTNFQPLEVTDSTISCNLEQRQRSSQQILDMADYLHMHDSRFPIRRWNSGKSFAGNIPLWVELSNPKSFLDYFKNKFESEDVMLIHFRPIPKQIKEFCRKQKWRCTQAGNVRGSEASVTILYDIL